MYIQFLRDCTGYKENHFTRAYLKLHLPSVNRYYYLVANHADQIATVIKEDEQIVYCYTKLNLDLFESSYEYAKKFSWVSDKNVKEVPYRKHRRAIDLFQSEEVL